MKRFANQSVLSIFVAGLICAISVPCFGQRNQGNGGGFGGQGGGRGGGFGGNNGQPPDPAQIQQMMQQRQQAQLDTLKTDLGASDDDFAAILPKIQRVIDAQTVVSIGTASMQANRYRGAFAGPNGQGGPGAQQPGGPNGANNPFATPGGVNQFLMQMTTSPVGKQLLQAVTELQTVLADPNAPADVILSRLQSLRMIKAKAAQDLVDAQADLQSILTQRQEAVMVVNGLLN
jgi:hypothetical protein